MDAVVETSLEPSPPGMADQAGLLQRHRAFGLPAREARDSIAPALSGAALHPLLEETLMKNLFAVVALSIAALSISASARAADAPGARGATCDSQAVDKKLAGAAKASFMKKCDADMAAAPPGVGVCDSQAADKKLAGAAKASFLKRCQKDSGVTPGVTCNAQATDKKLAGAAKASFLKKCMADAA